MALPPGVVTRTLTISAAVGSNPRKASLEVQIAPSKDMIVWSNTEEPLAKMFRTIRTQPDTAAVINLPAVDQAGFVDEDLRPITDWSYQITVRYLYDGRKIGQTVVKHFKPTSATPLVSDFDSIPTGDAPLNVGPQGLQGDSAYQVAVKNGFVGSEAAWLASLATGGVPPYTTWEQTTPAKEWIVVHNLGYNPGGVSVTDSANRKVWAPVEYIDKNTLKISMSAAMSGTVNLS